MDENERLLLPEEVADRLQVGVKWVYAAAQRGDLPHIKVGRYVRFVAADIDQWIEERKVR
jgi:excisionase family DNA binding protein